MGFNSLKIAAKEFDTFDEWDGQKKLTNAMWNKYYGTYSKFPQGVKEIVDFALSDEFVKWIQDVLGIEKACS